MIILEDETRNDNALWIKMFVNQEHVLKMNKVLMNKIVLYELAIEWEINSIVGTHG